MLGGVTFSPLGAKDDNFVGDRSDAIYFVSWSRRLATCHVRATLESTSYEAVDYD